MIFESKVVKYDEDGGTGLVLVSEEPEALFVIGIVTTGVSRRRHVSNGTSQHTTTFYQEKRKHFKSLIKKITCVWVSISTYIERLEKLISPKNKIRVKYNVIAPDLVR